METETHKSDAKQLLWVPNFIKFLMSFTLFYSVTNKGIIRTPRSLMFAVSNSKPYFVMFPYKELAW